MRHETGPCTRRPACLHTVRMAGVLYLALSGLPSPAAEPSLKWEVRCLAIDANEGIDIADFDRDGRLDVVAGRNWYAAPDYIPRPVRSIEPWSAWVESNGDHAYDVNQDGWMDVIAGSFMATEVHWYENPGKPRLQTGTLWPKHLLVDTGDSNNEGHLLEDLDGDGIPEWIVNSWSRESPLFAWQLSTEQRTFAEKEGQMRRSAPTMRRILIGSSRNGHGVGVGDLDGDGRQDVLFSAGWYQQPPEDPFAQEWIYHASWDLHASLPMLVRDLNRDGRNDVIAGKGHDFGLYWYEQKEPGPDGGFRFEQHLIDDSYSQTHTMEMADLDGDGREELVTGKRILGHNGRDPGGRQPPRIHYYVWDERSSRFHRHTIDEGKIGTGLRIRTADLNGDGRADIAVAGKSGTYLLLNLGY